MRNVEIIDVPGYCYRVHYSPSPGVFCGHSVVLRGEKYAISSYINDTIMDSYSIRRSMPIYDTPEQAIEVIKSEHPELFSNRKGSMYAEILY